MKITSWHFKKSALQVYELSTSDQYQSYYFYLGEIGAAETGTLFSETAFLFLHERSGTCSLSRIDSKFIIIFQIFKWHFFQRLAVFLKRQC